VTTPLTTLVLLLAGALGGWAAWFVVRDRAVVLRQLWGGAVLETVLAVQGVAMLVVAARGRSLDAPGEIVGYVVAQLLVLPLAAAWAFAERTRWSSVVLLVASLTVAFLELRLLHLWSV